MKLSQEAKGKSSVKNWILLIVLSYTVFIFTTTEFMPIGLLTDIATNLHISETRASLLISVYAWFVALMSLPLMLAVGKCDFRRLLLIIVGCFAVSHFLSAMASDFWTLLLSRLGVACSHAIFWSIISPLAIHIAPEGKREMAMSMVVTGTSLAMIAGMPLGRIVGLYLGWRYSFGSIGVAALLALVLLAFLFPSVSNNQTTSFKSLPTLLKSPIIASIYIFVALIVTAHYVGYSYIEPFLKQITGMTDDWATLTLTIFGVAGVGSSILFSRYYNKRRKPFLYSVSIGMVLVLLSMRLAASIQYLSIAHCILWGLIFTLFNLVTEFEVIRYSPQYATIAVAIYSSIFNIGIGAGAFIGGMALTYISLSSIGYIGGIIACIALVFSLKKLIPILSKGCA